MSEFRKASQKTLNEISRLLGKEASGKDGERPRQEDIRNNYITSTVEEVHPSNIIQANFTNEEEEFKHYLDPQLEYHPVAFDNPLEMLEIIYAGQKSVFTSPWKWQEEELTRLAKTHCNNKEPFRYILSANNGSGKDSFINAPWAVFQCLCKVRSRTVITTASYTQLVNQTESYIRSIAYAANNFFLKHGICDKMFLVKKEHIVCTQTGSEIIMFVTDDGGRAEGYHPFPDAPDGEVTIILNEAKTVQDIIFEHLSRCTYSRWLEVSSPGNTSGKHYKHIRAAINYPDNYLPTHFYARRITSFDCPHISEAKIESDKLEHGESSAYFRSKHLALFTSLDEQVVITKESIEQALLFPCKKLQLGIGRRAGLDLAGGGDENTLYVFDENECIGAEHFRAKDTAEVTIPVLVDFFKKYNLKGDNIYADDGGIGQAIIDGLRRNGYTVNRVLMQSAPSQKGQYGNRGAELWFRFSQFAQYIIYPPDNEKLKDQLTNRYYTQHKTLGKLILEAKKEARAKGHGSPDRADGCVLAWTGITVHDFLEVLGLEAPSVKVTVNKHLPVSKAIEYKPQRQRMNFALPERYPDDNREDLFQSGGKITFNNPGKLLRELYR